MVTVTGPPTGSFTLGFNGKTTTTLSNASTAAQVQTALQAIAFNNLGFPIPVTVTGNAGGPYTVTFAGSSQPQMTGTENAGTIFITTTTDGSHGTTVNPTVVQTLSVADNTGTLVLTFNNQSTPTLPAITLTGNPFTDAAAIQSALNSLPTIATTGTISNATSDPITGNIDITTTSTLDLLTGEQVTIAGVQGNTAANGTWTITVLNSTTFELNGSTSNGVYVPSGTWTLAGSVIVSADPTDTDFTVTFQGGLAEAVLPSLLVAAGTAGGTVSSPGATLQLQQGTNSFGPVDVTTEALTLYGNGINGDGALENVAGGTDTNTWGGMIILGSDSSIAADFDTVNSVPTTLNIDQSIVDLGNDFAVTILGQGATGSGTVAYTGTTYNTYTGLTTVAANGTLQLDKTGGAFALEGNLQIGTGNDTLDTAQLLASNQIVPTANVSIDSDGSFDLNGYSQTIENLNMTGGLVSLENTNPTSGPLAELHRDRQCQCSGGPIRQSGDHWKRWRYGASRSRAGGTATATTINVAQTLVVGGTAGTFTLSFGTGPGNTTVPLDITDPTLDVDMQAALDALTTIGGVGGSVTVTADPTLTDFTIVFGGSLAQGGNGTQPALPALVVGNLTGDATVAASNPPEMVINAVIADPLSAGTGTASVGLTKAGGGALQLTNTETYHGVTTVSGGLLLADGPVGSGTLPTNTVNAVTLAGGAIGGDGAVGSITPTTSGGAIEPGDFTSASNTGVLSVNNGNQEETWNSKTSFFVDLNDPTVPSPLPSSELIFTGNGAADTSISTTSLVSLNINNAVLTGVTDGTTPVTDAFNNPVVFTILSTGTTGAVIGGNFTNAAGQASLTVILSSSVARSSSSTTTARPSP